MMEWRTMVRRALVRCAVALSFALWVLAVASSPWGQAQAQAPSTPEDPATRRTVRTVRTVGPPGAEVGPGAATGAVADAERGIRFGLGFPLVEVTSDSLNQDISGGKVTDTGLMLNLDIMLGAFQLGYVHQVYRKSLGADVTYDGSQADTLAFDADQVWGFHVFRVGGSLTLAYGLGLQRRAVRVLLNEVTIFEEAETGLLAGLTADWTFAPPFSLNLRLFQDLSGDTLRQRGVSLQFNYSAGF